jgi:GT2 family glycosyltransferase
VDGDSSDGTEEMLRKNFANVKLVIDRREGISYARNIGGEMANGEIIAFTDDDCVVDKEWLMSLVTGFHNDRIGAVGGPAILLNPSIFPKKLVESPTLGTFSLGNRECQAKFLITANLAIRRRVFENTKFNVLFGQRNTLLFKWEEDVEFCQRLSRSGYKIIYIPTAKVYHDTSPSRAAFKYMITKEFSGGLSHFMVERQNKRRIQIAFCYFRNLVKAVVSFFQLRSISAFCFLIKMSAVLLASFFVP